MKSFPCRWSAGLVVVAWLGLTLAGCQRPQPPPQPGKKGQPVAAKTDGGEKEKAQPPQQVPAGKLAPLDIRLPAPAFRGTPVPLSEPNVEKPLGKPRPPFLAPEGTVNLAGGRPVVGSDPMPTAGEYDLVTDGDKEATDYGYVRLHSGTQWLQIDLGQKAAIYAVLVWHNHAEARVYRDLVVQISEEADFLDAQTVFNSDYDNSSGLGIGSQLGYVETAEGKLIDCKGFEGRYVRLYSRGNTIDEDNHYTEVEVYGRPVQ